MEIPNARILEDGVMRIAYTQADPYRWYTGGMGVFPGLEFSGRLTEMTNIPTQLGGGKYGAYKDKAFDLKYQILPESKRFPALAVGIHDFHGTRLFPAQYLVVSRQIFPFDFTMGIGRQRLKGPISLVSDELGLWGGIEWVVHKRLHLMAEYNPIEYEKDVKSAGKAVPEGAQSQVNIGLRLKVLPGLDLGVSWQRGDTLGVMANLQFLLGQPIQPKRPDPPRWGLISRQAFNAIDAPKMLQKIKNEIQTAGLQDVSVYTNGQELTAEFENNKYISDSKAAGRVLRILLYNAPSDTQNLIAILKRRQMTLLIVSVKPKHLDQYLLGKISDDLFAELVTIETAATSKKKGHRHLFQTAAEKHFNYDFGVKPNFETFLNDPSGFFKFRLGVQPFAAVSPWRGAELYGRYDIPFYSGISSSNTAPPDSARSDSWKYGGNDFTFVNLEFSQTLPISNKLFGLFRCGYFEPMYAGVGGELLTFWGVGNLAIGLEGDWVRKREPGTQLALLNFEKHTLLSNIYYHLSGPEITLQAQYGHYLGDDEGWRFIAKRQYSTGVILGAWYSFTDTDHFKDPYNRGYHDKGIFLSLPASMFRDYETSRRYQYSISPWTRDVAQTVKHRQNLFDLLYGRMLSRFKSNINRIKE